MNLAQAAWESGDARRTLELLRPWVPKPGEEDLRGFEWHYWNRQAHQETRSVRLEGLTPAERAAGLLGGLSRDGTRAAGVVNDQNRSAWTLRAWDAASGRELWRAAPIRGGFESCVFSDDGRRLLTWNELWASRRDKGGGGGPCVGGPRRHVCSTPRLRSRRQDPCRSWRMVNGSVMDVREGKGDISHVAPMTGMRIIRLSDGKELTRIPSQT